MSGEEAARQEAVVKLAARYRGWRVGRVVRQPRGLADDIEEGVYDDE